MEIVSSDESGQNVTKLNNGEGVKARDFAIYRPDNLLYWTSYNDTIQVARLTPDGRGTMLGSIQTQADIKPDQISISSQKGQIVFTNKQCAGFNSNHCELIFKANMDGSDRCTILTGTPAVSSLTVEEKTDELSVYWNDAGKIRRTSVGDACQGPHGVGEEIKESTALSMGVINQKIYWIEQSNKEMMPMYVSRTNRDRNHRDRNFSR